MKKLLTLALVILGFSVSSFAQVTATATATGTIVSPINISKTLDMNFGNVAVNGTAGTVVLVPAGTRSVTGGVTLPASAGTVSTARFTVTGTSGYTYAITLPVVATTVTSGANTMTVSTFTNDATGTLTGGTQIVNVGGTLNVAGAQAAGTYVSGIAFPVTVNYN